MNTALLSVFVSAAVGISATIIPSITTIISNRYQLRLKKLELENDNCKNFLLHKREIFENYLMSVGKFCVCYEYVDSEKEYKESYHLILLYVPAAVKEQLDQIDSLFQQNKFDDITCMIPSITDSLQSLLQQ